VPIPFCVTVRCAADIPSAVRARVDGAVVKGNLGVARACAGAGLPVVAVRVDAAIPHQASVPLLPPGTPPTLVLLPPPAVRPEDTRSIERVKAFRLATLAALRSVGEWAEKAGHTVAVASSIDSFFEGALELVEVIRAARCPSLRYALNTFDAEASGDTLSGATDITADLLGHVVAQDAVDGRRVPPGRGDGQVDLARLLEELDLLEYSGAVEVAGSSDEWADAIEFLRRARP